MEMLDASNASFWVHENLLEPQSLQQDNLSSAAEQQQSAHHLFPAHPAAVLHQEEICLELGGYGTCGGAFPQTVQQRHSDTLPGSVEDRQFMPSLHALPEFRYTHTDTSIQSNYLPRLCEHNGVLRTITLPALLTLLQALEAPCM